MKQIQNINDRKTAGKNKGFSIMKGTFRLLVEKERAKKLVEYAPSVEGPIPAFLHSAKHLQKFLAASFKIFRSYRVHRLAFDAKPYHDEFGHLDIDDNTWYHAFTAMNVSTVIFSDEAYLKKYSQFQTTNCIFSRKP